MYQKGPASTTQQSDGTNEFIRWGLQAAGYGLPPELRRPAIPPANDVNRITHSTALPI